MVALIPRYPQGFRLTTGDSLNVLVDAVNSMAANLLFVNGSTGNNSFNGSSEGQPVATVARGLALAAETPGSILYVAPGSYDEAITIARGDGYITVVGAGPPGSVAIAPTTLNASALTNHADGVSLINVGLAANGTGKALINTGSRLVMYRCKLENDDGTGECAQMTLGTVAQHTAGTRGNGADCTLLECEYAWAEDGIEIVCTDYGAVTELKVVNCLFHDMLGDHIYETVGSGGSAAVMYATLLLKGNTHMKAEDGTAPAHYVLLNGNNANTGVMAGGFFPQATNGGKVLLSTALLAVGVFFTGGISAAQPS